MGKKRKLTATLLSIHNVPNLETNTNIEEKFRIIEIDLPVDVVS